MNLRCLRPRVSLPQKKIYPLVIHQSTANESLTNQSRVSPRRRHSRGTINRSRVSAGSMLSHWTNSQSRVSAGSMISHRNTNQSRDPSQGAILSHSESTQSIVPESALTAHPSRMTTWWHRVRRVFSRLSWRKRHQRIPKPPQANPNLDHFGTHGHTFVYATFSKFMS